MGYKRGENRHQISLLPEALDDYVGANSVVRFIDQYVDSLDLKGLGFSRTQLASTGQRPYSPECLLKLYVYGYLHQVRSSRQLARQGRLNVELIWLLEKLSPEHKTIADFRRDNGTAISGVVSEFRRFCRQLGLYGDDLVAIDGSYFKASNRRDGVLSEDQLSREQARLEGSVSRYLEQLDQIDSEEDQAEEPTVEELEEKLEEAQEALERTRSQREALASSGRSQCGATDPDARLLRKGGQTMVGYNAQIAVDGKHHLIVGHAISCDGNDAPQLAPMVAQLGSPGLTVVADSGYQSREGLLACSQQGVTAYVAGRERSSSKADGRFSKSDFTYDADADVYRCPAGEALKRVGERRTQLGHRLQTYRAKACRDCKIRDDCLKQQTPFKQMSRWEHEHLVEANESRVAAHPEMMRRRKGLAEHPFGTLKRWSGSEHFLTRGKANVATELTLSVLCYNLKRAIKELGIENLLSALKQRAAPA